MAFSTPASLRQTRLHTYKSVWSDVRKDSGATSVILLKSSLWGERCASDPAANRARPGPRQATVAGRCRAHVSEAMPLVGSTVESEAKSLSVMSSQPKLCTRRHQGALMLQLLAPYTDQYR